MTARLYIKPDKIGLCFANQADRDFFWTLLGEQQNCAEKFGERTIRFNASKATASFSVPLETETLRVVVDKPAQVHPAAAKPALVVQIEAPVIPAAPAPISPVAIIPAEAPLISEPAGVIFNVPVGHVPPDPAIPIPQVASVTMTPLPTSLMPQIASMVKPPDLRSREGRAWKQAQQAAAKA